MIIGKVQANGKASSAPGAAEHNGHTPPKLQRLTFRTSREMDFFSEKELTTQTGHIREEWPLVIVKELMDSPASARASGASVQARATW
jgi:hypothetical protein